MCPHSGDAAVLTRYWRERSPDLDDREPHGSHADADLRLSVEESSCKELAWSD